MQKLVFVSLVLGSLFSNSSFATMDCSDAAIAAASAAYNAQDHDVQAGSDSAYPTPIGRTGLTAYEVPLFQSFNGSFGCGIGRAYVVIMDSECKVRGAPIEE